MRKASPAWMRTRPLEGLEAAPGIEPGIWALQALALPLGHAAGMRAGRTYRAGKSLSTRYLRSLYSAHAAPIRQLPGGPSFPGAYPAMTDAALTVAVQGELGSNSELAAREYFDGRDVDVLPCRTFAALFSALSRGRAEAAMAPVENSLAGSIHEVWDLLRERPLPVCGEIRLRIGHHLIAPAGTRLEDLRRIRSHPQALAQCREFLDGLEEVQVEPVYDTAGAVMMVKAEGRSDEAAIATAQAAEDNGMQVLVADLAGRHNFTRFLVLGEGTGSGGSPKTTVVLEMDHTAAGLPAVLGQLTRAGLEVLKVETRKRVGRPWAYLVYLDFAGDAAAEPAAGALREVAGLVAGQHLVGTYPAGITAEPRLYPR